MKKCENCVYYKYTSNILGGIAECLKEVKPLTTFWNNDACDLYIEDETPNNVSIIHLGDI